MYCKLLIIFILSIMSILSSAQDQPFQKQILAGYEINYFGKNSFVHGRFLKNNHIIETGINYNFSDGFSDDPVIGIGLYYGYQVITSKKWKTFLGAEYRRQKPLKIVNIQTLCYTTSVQYNYKPNWSLLSRIGYGVATERSASDGSFDQFNNLTGSISLSCVYHL
jgi:hypothetical protein